MCLILSLFFFINCVHSFLSAPHHTHCTSLGMREQGLSLEKYASKDVKVLVVANPANTNMLVLLKTVKKIPQGNFTCLTRLDEERLRHFVADKINTDLGKLRGEVDDKSEGKAVTQIVRSRDVQNVFIFGNHSTTQVRDVAVLSS